MGVALLEDPVDVRQEDACRDEAVHGLEQHIQRCLCGRLRDFRLSLHAQGLVLNGQASTYHAKQLAQHEIMAQTRLPILANDIVVLTPDGHRP